MDQGYGFPETADEYQALKMDNLDQGIAGHDRYLIFLLKSRFPF